MQKELMSDNPCVSKYFSAMDNASVSDIIGVAFLFFEIFLVDGGLGRSGSVVTAIPAICKRGVVNACRDLFELVFVGKFPVHPAKKTDDMMNEIMKK